MGFIVEKDTGKEKSKDANKEKPLLGLFVVGGLCYSQWTTYQTEGSWQPFYWFLGFAFLPSVHFILRMIVWPRISGISDKTTKNRVGSFLIFSYFISILTLLFLNIFFNRSLGWFSRGFDIGFAVVGFFFWGFFRRMVEEFSKFKKENTQN